MALSVLVWMFWSIHAAKALILAALLACVVDSTIIMLMVNKQNAPKSLILMFWLADMISTFWAMFFKIPMPLKKYTQYFVCLAILFLYFCAGK